MITESIMHKRVGTPDPDPESAGIPLRTSPVLQTCAKTMKRLSFGVLQLKKTYRDNGVYNM